MVSIDGVGAFIFISRNAMLQALLEIDRGDQIMPTILRTTIDTLVGGRDGRVHEIAQGEGGEQSDHLMPLLFSLGQHAALAAANARLQDCQRLLAHLDDIHVICLPRRVLEVHRVLQEELWAHVRIRIHHGKTQLGNRSGSEPAGVAELTLAACLVEPNAVVWKSDPELPLSQNGLRFLGAPIAHPLHVVDQLVSKSVEQELFFQRIPAKEDLQSSVAVVAVLWSNTRQFLVEICHCLSRRGTMTEFGMLRQPPPRANTVATRKDYSSDASVQRGVGFWQCCACPSCGPLCELGRQFVHGEAGLL